MQSLNIGHFRIKLPIHDFIVDMENKQKNETQQIYQRMSVAKGAYPISEREKQIKYKIKMPTKNLPVKY